MALDDVAALTFDVFGTVVDWRSSIARELRSFLVRAASSAIGRPARIGGARSISPRWRRCAAAAACGSGSTTCIARILRSCSMSSASGLHDDEIEHLNRAWHRLEPWPDAVEDRPG